jgi:hypothetical protein
LDAIGLHQGAKPSHSFQIAIGLRLRNAVAADEPDVLNRRTINHEVKTCIVQPSRQQVTLDETPVGVLPRHGMAFQIKRHHMEATARGDQAQIRAIAAEIKCFAGSAREMAGDEGPLDLAIAGQINIHFLS